jgi:hypothetical protein
MRDKLIKCLARRHIRYFDGFALTVRVFADDGMTLDPFPVGHRVCRVSDDLQNAAERVAIFLDGQALCLRLKHGQDDGPGFVRAAG